MKRLGIAKLDHHVRASAFSSKVASFAGELLRVGKEGIGLIRTISPVARWL